MKPYNFFNEVKSETKPVTLPLEAMKRLEDARPLFPRDATSFISHGDAGRSADLNGYPAAAAAVLDRVLHKIGNGALNGRPIAENSHHLIISDETGLVIGGDRERRQF